MSNEINAPGLLETVLPGHSFAKSIEADRAEITRRKAEYEAALKRVKAHSTKEGRDKIRAQKRRDEIIGHLFTATCEKNNAFWMEFEPDLLLWLDKADDADRELFSLPPMKANGVKKPEKVDKEEASKTAADQKPEPVQQPAS